MKKTLVILLVLFAIACSDVKTSPEPKNLFTKDKMAGVITDLYILEGAISSNKNVYNKSGIQPSSYMYEKYEMDSISFQENLNYYTDRVEDYLLIMDQVQENLKSLQDSISARQERKNKEDKNKVPVNKVGTGRELKPLKKQEGI